jgi:hypothetical protein
VSSGQNKLVGCSLNNNVVCAPFRDTRSSSHCFSIHFNLIAIPSMKACGRCDFYPYPCRRRWHYYHIDGIITITNILRKRAMEEEASGWRRSLSSVQFRINEIVMNISVRHSW